MKLDSPGISIGVKYGELYAQRANLLNLSLSNWSTFKYFKRFSQLGLYKELAIINKTHTYISVLIPSKRPKIYQTKYAHYLRITTKKLAKRDAKLPFICVW